MAPRGSGSAPDLYASALSEARGTFPGAATSVLWTDHAGDRAIVVVGVDLNDEQFLYQVVCLREGELWHSWTSGPAPGWLEVEDPFGVVTRCDRLEHGTQAVQLYHFGDMRVIEVDDGLFFQALWDVTVADGEWSWPEATAVLVRGRWEPAAVLGLPLRMSFLVERYVWFESSHDTPDQWAWDAVMQAVRDRPEDAWPVVLGSVEAAPSDQVLFTIAAGPLEDLIAEHSDLVIGLIEEAATTSEKLRRALGGVWAHVADPEVAARLERLTKAGHSRR